MKLKSWTMFASLLCLIYTRFASAAPLTIDFEDLSLSANSYWKGPDPAGVDQPDGFGGTNRVGSFQCRGATFNNSYNLGFGSWQGWAYSNTTDITTPGVTPLGVVVNESSAYHLPAGGGDSSPNYGVAFGESAGTSVISLPAGYRPDSMRVTNTTYAALIMLTGDPNHFAKKFGGDSGTDPDFFLLSIIGLNTANQSVGTVNFYLADYRSDISANDYVVEHWTTVDLSNLSSASKLTFALTSSDNSTFGGLSFSNTPTYFAMDNLVLNPVPEPATWILGMCCAACSAALIGRNRVRSRRRVSSVCM